VRSRRRRALAIAWLLAAGVALARPTAQGSDIFPDSHFVKQQERFTPDGGAPVDLRFAIAREAAGQATRVVNTTRAALTLMWGWFGSLPGSSLDVAAVFSPPGFPLGHLPGDPGIVTVPVHWLTPARDQRTERELIHGIVRESWSTVRFPPAFEQALIDYLAARATHQLLEGSNFATLTFFGGFVPFPLRSVLLSPPVADPRPRAWRFDEPERVGTSEQMRRVRALQTIERYVGWPTMLEALSRVRHEDRRDPETFATALSELRGTDMRPLVAECLRPGAMFDYSLDGLHSVDTSSGLVETTVTISRRGSGRFAIGDEKEGRDQSMPLLVRFADGSEVRDYFDGAAGTVSRVYSAKTAAIAAAVDPDRMLLLDDDRDNNTIVRDTSVSPLGIRLAFHWMAWLQSAMLSYTALV